MIDIMLLAGKFGVDMNTQVSLILCPAGPFEDHCGQDIAEASFRRAYTPSFFIGLDNAGNNVAVSSTYV